MDSPKKEKVIKGYSLFYREEENIDNFYRIHLDFCHRLVRKEIIRWYYNFLQTEEFDIYVLLKAGFHLISLYVRDYEVEEGEVTTIALAALHIIHSLLGQTKNEDMDISKYTNFIVFEVLGKSYSPKLEILPDELWKTEIKMMEYPIHIFLGYLDNREYTKEEEDQRIDILFQKIQNASK